MVGFSSTNVAEYAKKTSSLAYSRSWSGRLEFVLASLPRASETICFFLGLCRTVNRNLQRNWDARTKQMFIRIVDKVVVIDDCCMMFKIEEWSVWTITFARNNSTRCLVFIITQTNPAISNSVGQKFFSAADKSLDKKKRGSIVERRGHLPSGTSFSPWRTWKSIAPKPNSLEASWSSQRSYVNSWCINMNGFDNVSWRLEKLAVSLGVGGGSLVLKENDLRCDPSSVVAFSIVVFRVCNSSAC